jgi:hypothetical protein
MEFVKFQKKPDRNGSGVLNLLLLPAGDHHNVGVIKIIHESET